jgi:hypothetical protein
MTTTIKRSVAVALFAAVFAPAPAHAQLDPLLFLKTTQPNIILAVDTAQRMQRDADNTYYDPANWTETGAGYESAMGLAAAEAAKVYRRKYFNLKHSNVNDINEKFTASRIAAVGDLESDYSTFYERTRLAIARRAMIQAIADNTSSARFGLVRMRQAAINISVGNENPVVINDPANVAQTLTGDVSSNKWKISRNLVSGTNTSQGTSGLMVSASVAGANTSITTILGRGVTDTGFDNLNRLVPAGLDTITTTDAPLGVLLDDVKAHATTLINADVAAGGCRNTVVVLITGGGEGTISPANLATKASSFLAINGRRVPIYVVALFPTADEATALQAVATTSGGQYFEITKVMVESALATSSTGPVPDVVRAINTAVQHAFVPSTTFNVAPTVTLPYGQLGEWQVTSPIVGTVNLRNASKMLANGALEPLPDSETHLLNGTTEIPQRSNVLVTSGFTLPGFDAKIRAFRVYKPVVDASQPSGYKFVQDGSKLWEASVPAAGSRNLYTILPGTGTLVPFTAANVAQLQSYLNVSDPTALIEYVRSQPMGAIVGSTPAFLDVPSLDPPPDTDYPGFREEHKDRRSLIFVGANDGIMHALDARTGLEVWGFIPFNLLPKLKSVRYGQSLDAFKYFVDSSPKISDVKVNGEWRTYLFFGQGPGGTFYNALDVTLADINDAVAEDSTNSGALLTHFANTDVIQWEWSFPRLTSFDAEIGAYGELALANASLVEQTVGETWSDPAIGQVHDASGPYVMIVGSGYLKYSVQSVYRTGVTRAGTTFYVLNVKDGLVLGSKDVGADTNAETNNDCRTVNDCRKHKNALQMDPVATGPQESRFVSIAYIGDLDGNVWKFSMGAAGGALSLSNPTKLYAAGADYPLFASMATVNVGGSNHIFVGTGSDLLPSPDAAVKKQTSSLLVLLDNGTTATKKAEILLEAIDGTAGEEKVTTFPAVAGDIVFFTTTTYNANAATICAAPYTANLYAFTFIGGPAYDTNNDGKLSSGTTGSTGGGKGKGGGGGSVSADSQKVFTEAGKRATAPFIVDQHLVFSTGGTIQMFGNQVDYNNGVGQAGVRILSWRTVK